MFDWIKDRISEGSTHTGVIVAAAAAACLFAGYSITQVVLWAALAWGVYSIVKSEF